MLYKGNVHSNGFKWMIWGYPNFSKPPNEYFLPVSVISCISLNSSQKMAKDQYTALQSSFQSKTSSSFRSLVTMSALRWNNASETTTGGSWIESSMFVQTTNDSVQDLKPKCLFLSWYHSCGGKLSCHLHLLLRPSTRITSGILN